MDIYFVDYLKNENVELPNDFKWVDNEDLKLFSFPTLMRKILKKNVND